MEKWNDGILENLRSKFQNPNFKTNPKSQSSQFKVWILEFEVRSSASFHYSIIPIFQYVFSVMHEVCIDLRTVLHEIVNPDVPILSRKALAEDLSLEF